MNKFIKFLQVSDVHLDSSFSSSINFPVNKLEIRKSEHKSIITKVCQIVRDEDIDLVLIPGDLIDYESSTPDTTNFLIDNFSKISPVPVIITPGNHDYFSPSSVYNSDFLTGKQQNVWTENVFIFTAQKFQSISLPNLKEISITGISHYENRSFYNRLLTDNILKQEGKINILVFHGSRDGYCPSDKKITLPFSDEELFKLGFDYSAIGHYHSYLEILDEEGNIKGAYSGCPLGRNLREFGEKFIIIGKIYEDKKVEIEKRRIDHRIMLKIDVDCTGLNYNEQVLNIIAEKVKETTNSKEDIIYVRLFGRFPPGNVINIPDEFLKDDYFHIKFDKSNVQPDYDIKKYLDIPDILDTTESKFVKKLNVLLKNAKSDSEKEIIENAIYYGLDALIQKCVKPRYED
jgi:DNA repair exonuclease SbcCD nuclease subunit